MKQVRIRALFIFAAAVIMVIAFSGTAFAAYSGSGDESVHFNTKKEPAVTEAGGRISDDGIRICEANGTTPAKHVVIEPKPKHTLTVLTNEPSCQVEYKGVRYDSGQTFEIPEDEEVLLYARAGSGFEFDEASSDETEVIENGSIGRIIRMPESDAAVTFDFIPLKYIETVDIGNIWTLLDPLNEIPFTAEIHDELDEDGVNFRDKMEIIEESWYNTGEGEDVISSSSPGKVLVGNKYHYSIMLRAKKGWAFRDPAADGSAGHRHTFKLIVGGEEKTFRDTDPCVYGQNFKTVLFGPMDMEEGGGLVPVDPVDITRAEVSGITDKEWTGQEVTQAPSLRIEVNGTEFTPEEGTDYTLSYENNVNAGTATVKITGSGNYTGTISKTFAITGGPAPEENPEDQAGPGGSGDTGGHADPLKQMGEDGTAFGKGASAEAAEAAILSLKNDNDPAGTVFSSLQFKASRTTKNSIKLTWKKVKGARKYVLYANKCGKKNKYKKLKTLSKNSLVVKKVAGKKLKKGTHYKFLLVALDGSGSVLTVSTTVHAATAGGKITNPKKVTTKAKKNKVALKVKKSFKLGAKAVKASGKLKMPSHRAMKYESSNVKVAEVSGKGVIKGVKKGTCWVYAYAQNGVCAKVKVIVR